MRKASLLAIAFIVFALSISQVSAHVTVKPNEVKPSTYQTFLMSVPNEKNIDTTSMKLLIPSGLRSVTPNVKPGWKINFIKEGDVITAIEWTGGVIPVDQRDEFLFSAQAPAAESTIQWKAYQTYSDGTVVSWDDEPSTDTHASEVPNKGPFSETKVFNTTPNPRSEVSPSSDVPTQEKSNYSIPLSLAAIALGASSLGLQLYKRK